MIDRGFLVHTGMSIFFASLIIGCGGGTSSNGNQSEKTTKIFSFAEDFSFEQPFRAHVLSYHPQDPDIIIASSHFGENGVVLANYRERSLVSFDRPDDPWASISSPRTLALVVHPANSNHYIKLTDNPFAPTSESFDEGANWVVAESRDATPIDGGYLELSPDGAALYLYQNHSQSFNFGGTFAGFGISIDYGASWLRVNEPMISSAGPMATSLSDPNRIYIYTWINAPKLWGSFNQGATWEELRSISVPRPSSFFQPVVAADPFNADVIYAIGARDDVDRAQGKIGLLKSTDAGATWRRSRIYDSLNYEEDQFLQFAALAMSRYDSCLAYVSFQKRFGDFAFQIARSSDCGQTWSVVADVSTFSYSIVIGPRRGDSVEVFFADSGIGGISRLIDQF